VCCSVGVLVWVCGKGYRGTCFNVGGVYVSFVVVVLCMFSYWCRCLERVLGLVLELLRKVWGPLRRFVYVCYDV
jgi:hypothetical protein